MDIFERAPSMFGVQTLSFLILSFIVMSTFTLQTHASDTDSETEIDLSPSQSSSLFQENKDYFKESPRGEEQHFLSLEENAQELKCQIQEEERLYKGKLSQSLRTYIDRQKDPPKNKVTIYSFLLTCAPDIQLKIDGNLRLIRQLVEGLTQMPDLTQKEANFFINKMTDKQELQEFYQKAFSLINPTESSFESLRPLVNKFYAEELVLTLRPLYTFEENESLENWKIKTTIVRLNFSEFLENYSKGDKKIKQMVYKALEQPLWCFYEESMSFLKDRYSTRSFLTQTMQVYARSISRTKMLYESFKYQYLIAFDFIKEEKSIYKKIEELNISCEEVFEEEDEKAANLPSKVISNASSAVTSVVLTTTDSLMKGALKIWYWK